MHAAKKEEFLLDDDDGQPLAFDTQGRDEQREARCIEPENEAEKVMQEVQESGVVVLAA